MNSRNANPFRFFFVCVDLVMLNLVHITLVANFHRIPQDGEKAYGLLYLIGNIIWLISAYSVGLYVEHGQSDVYRFTKKTLKAFLLFTACLFIFAFMYHYPFSRLFIFMNLSGFFFLLIVTRVMAGISYLMTDTHRPSRRIVILGYNDLSKKFAESFALNHKDVQVDGFFENLSEVHELSRFSIIGDIDECLDYAISQDINEIYSSISPEKNDSIYEMAKAAEKSLIRFKFIPDFRSFVNRDTYIEYQNNFPVLSLRPEPLADMSNSIKKRIFDIAFSLLVIVLVLSWMIPILGLLIIITSRGPVFFKQMRSGKNNKQFSCYKLRTLTVNNEANTKQVTLDDARVTRLGRFLRKTNLDELPQFVNVLLGNMSVVGPRPHMLAHTNLYSQTISEYTIRHFLKPGITGWAQVNGFRGEIKGEDQLRNRINHDIWFMENWSIWLDIKIIALTAWLTFKGDKNAY